MAIVAARIVSALIERSAAVALLDSSHLSESRHLKLLVHRIQSLHRLMIHCLHQSPVYSGYSSVLLLKAQLHLPAQLKGFAQSPLPNCLA